MSVEYVVNLKIKTYLYDRQNKEKDSGIST